MNLSVLPKRRAVFLDRDGVLIEAIVRDGKPFAARRWSEVKLIPGVREELFRLTAGGFLLFVVTNQPDIARRLLTLTEVEEIHAKLLKSLGGESVIRQIYTCPHDNQDGCDCRKPKPGLILQAAETWRVDTAGSFIIGDRDADVKAGKAAGCRTVLIDMPYNQEAAADYRAKTFREAADWILNFLP